MQVTQKVIETGPFRRGFHLIDHEVFAHLRDLIGQRSGILHLFIQHSSASLSINENADPDVRHDMAQYFDRYVPENEPYFRHTTEGSDDMPAHIKTVLLGSSLMIPVQNGQLMLGTWQGIYLAEHRNNAGKRKIVLNFLGT